MTLVFDYILYHIVDADHTMIQTEGFNRAPEMELPDSTFVGAIVLNSDERARDADLLEQIAFRPTVQATPRVAAPARQYINSQG